MKIAKAVAKTTWLIVCAIDIIIGWIGFGTPTTVSHHAAKARNLNKPWGCWLCKKLDLIDPGHCDTALLDPFGPFD